MPQQESDFQLTITRRDGSKVHLRPGGIAERQLVVDVLSRLATRNLGYLTSQSTVLAAVAEALTATLHAAKSDILPGTPPQPE